MDIAIQIHTSAEVSVRIDVDPNRVVQTSPARLDDVANRFISRYPKARAPTEIIAIAASPFTFVFCPVLKSKTALITVTGRITSIRFVRFITEAIARAPNATWDKPSPI